MALAVAAAQPGAVLARGGHGGGVHGGGFHGGGRGGGHAAGGFRGGAGAVHHAPGGYHGGPAAGFRGGAAGGYHPYGGAGNLGGFHHGPSLNYSRGYTGLNAANRAAINRSAINHNLGLSNRTAINNRINTFNRTAVHNNNLVNNVNRYGNWHRGYWNGHWGGYGGNWGAYGRRGYGGYGGLGYGLGGYGLGGYGLGGFGSGMLLGSALGYGLGGYGLGGYGLGGYGLGGYGLGGYGLGGYGRGMLGWGLPSWGLGSWPYMYGYSSYANPYYTTPSQVTYLNYAQPIAVDAAAPADTAVDTASQEFAAARDAFKAADYGTALQRTDAALKSLPNDVDLHQFRALTLMAMGRYAESAAALYAVLNAGPGWNWATLIGFYANADTFTNQLRALEQYISANSNAASARFVLAYLYLTMGSNDAAVRELRDVVRLQPDDRLSQQLLEDLAQPASASAQPAGASGAAPPAVQEAAAEPSAPLPTDLTGTWTAQGAGGTTVRLTLQPDGHFQWATTGGAEAKSFDGTYTTGSGLMTLVGSDGLAIVGRLNGAGGNGFRFKLVGSGNADPGLTFTR
jgi:tetratricopeptide (TPR) repeat protein